MDGWAEEWAEEWVGLRNGRTEGWVDGMGLGMGGGMGGFKEWADGGMGLRVGFINILVMYNKTVGKGGSIYL